MNRLTKSRQQEGFYFSEIDKLCDLLG
jgi:hypothetical protein